MGFDGPVVRTLEAAVGLGSADNDTLTNGKDRVGNPRRHQLGLDLFGNSTQGLVTVRAIEARWVIGCVPDVSEVEERVWTASWIVSQRAPFDRQERYGDPGCPRQGHPAFLQGKISGATPHEDPDAQARGVFQGVAPAPAILISTTRCRPGKMSKPLQDRRVDATTTPRTRHRDASPTPSPCLAERISARHSGLTTIRCVGRGSCRRTHITFAVVAGAVV